ncbi:MAG: PAS domain S-box protein [Nitrospirae bacterium]|nr:PAS domain S-box protein [Nitrospirota bacterium]
MNGNASFISYGPRQLSLLIGSILAVTLLIGWISLSIIERQLLETTGHTLALAAGEVADKLDRIVFERRGDAQMMARAFTSRCRDTSFISTYLKWVSQAYPLYESLSMLDAQGHVVTTTNASLASSDFSHRPWFEQMRDGRVKVIYQWESTKLAGQEVGAGVSFAAPITDSSGLFCGVVLSRVGLSVLGDTVTRKWEPLSIDTTPFSALEYQFVTSEGLDFVNSLQHASAVPSNLRELAVPSFLRAESEEIGFVEELHVRRHVPVVTGFARTHGYRDSVNPEWIVLLRVDRSTLLAPIRTRVLFVGLLGLMGVLPLSLGLLWALRRLKSVGVVAQSEHARAGEAEEALQESRERFAGAFQNATIGMALVGTDGRWLQVNRALCEIVGYSEPELTALTFQAITHPDDLGADLASVDKLLAGELCAYYVEKRYLHKLGHPIWIALSTSLVRGRQGDPLYFVSQIQDITARKEAEAALAASEQKFRLLAESAIDVIYRLNEQGQIIYVSPASEKVLGYTPQEMIGSHFSEYFSVSELPKAVNAFKAAMVGEFLPSLQLSITAKDGRAVPTEVNVAPIEEYGAVVGVHGIVRDITLRQQIEKALHDSEARLQGIIESAMDAIVTIDEDRRVVVFNAMAEKIFGWKAGEIIGQPIEVLLPLRVRPGHPALVQRFIESGSLPRAMGGLSQIAGLRATGEEFPVEAAISKTMVGGRTYCSVILRDVTDRRRNEVALLSRTRQQAAVAQLGFYALSTHDADLVLHEAARLVAEALEADFCKVLELLPAGDMCLLRAGMGWREGLVGNALVSAGLDSQAGHTLKSRAPIVVRDLRSETRFSGPPLLHQHGVVSGMSAVIYSNGHSWGVLGVHTKALRAFGQDDIHFLQAVANVLGATLERQGAEQALKQSELLLRASLDERERMALNLHDGVIQSLFAMGLTLRESQELIGENTEAARAQVGEGLAALKGVIRELRESIIGGAPLANSSSSSKSFQEILTDLVVAAQGPRGIVFQVTLASEALSRLAGDAEEHLLFIVREAVSNAQRHSHGTSGQVTLALHNGGARLVIEDNGQGFDSRKVSGRGLGLSNMAVRAEKIGARCEVQSSRGKGVRIVVELPGKETTCRV